MRRALVILGDSEFASAIIGGVKSNEQQLVPVNVSPYKEDVKKSVHCATGCRNWRELYYDMICTYGFPEDYKPDNIVCQTVTTVWAMMWYGISAFYQRMAEKNRN